ncbi:DUF4917 family protein [Arcobacter porcinus]|uniref:DUF4917 family protein n=1 Tax=Arcobacter porcinus TaxID=1935204 RepID=UPI000824DA02|nr:DUF4917 family protein [Arcobacter porcinus]
MKSELLSYREIMKDIKEQKKYLLLGNGFSMAYNSKRFSFTSLLDNAVERGLINKTSPIYKVFTQFDTKDFEEVVKLLETSTKVLKTYGVLSKVDEKKILDDSKSLKKYLVDVITNNHPDKITEISDDEFFNSANFIKNFDKVYTLNYDLLLYWSCIKLQSLIEEERIQDSVLDISDGFYDPHAKSTDYVVFGNDGAPQNIYFIHGGLHIFDKKSEIIKNTFSRTDKSLKEQTLENLNKDIYPIFVSEGTSEQKKAKIIHNAYLNHCYKSLSSIGTKNSSLVIFGTLLKRNDVHIRQAILKSKVENIYIGISKKSDIKEFTNFIDKASKLKKAKKIFFYDYKTVKVWR